MLLRFRPPFSDEWTTAEVEGESSHDAVNILATRLLFLEWEVEAEDTEGDFLPVGEVL